MANDVITIKTENKFRSLVARQDFARGQVVYAIPSEKVFDKPNRFTVQMDRALHTEVGKLSALNHSCDPNVGFTGQIGLVAMCDIQAGEELTFDYAMCDGSEYDEFDCYCGSKNCRGHVKGSDWSRPELWEKYDGYFMPYLARRIEMLKARSHILA